MRGLSFIVTALVALSFLATSCSTAPKTTEEKDKLESQAQKALAEMKAKDPSLDAFLKSSYGYAVFPSIGKGAVIVGGAYGKGVVYESVRKYGFMDMTQASVGLALGGQSFKEIVACQDKESFMRFISGKLTFDANFSAVAVKSGAASTAKFKEGVTVFTDPNAGAMFEMSLSGQTFSFEPIN